jgi:hypothetical protein
LVALSGHVLDGGSSNEAGSEKEDLLARARLGLLLSLEPGGVDTLEDLRKKVLALLDHSSAELGKDKGGRVDLGVVVSAVGNLSEGDANLSVGLLGAGDESDLAGRV